MIQIKQGENALVPRLWYQEDGETLIDLTAVGVTLSAQIISSVDGRLLATFTFPDANFRNIGLGETIMEFPVALTATFPKGQVIARYSLFLPDTEYTIDGGQKDLPDDTILFVG